MSYKETRSANGRICCAGDPTNFCDSCKTKAGVRTASGEARRSPEDWQRHFQELLGINETQWKVLALAPEPRSVGYDPYGEPMNGYEIALAKGRTS